MLTATYSLVTISTEQSKVRRILVKLQQCIRNAWRNLKENNLSSIESAFNSLSQFDKYFRTRKVEVYLIPAVRRATSNADTFLEELESLSAVGMDILRSVREQLRRAAEGGGVRIGDICNSMELYCSQLLKRLAREEEELFALARRLFSVDEWFALAAKFLSEEQQSRASRQQLRQPPLFAPVPLAPMPAHH